jgi:hypothetical protein
VLAHDQLSGEPAPGCLAWAEGRAGIWLLRDWHPPVPQADGQLEWHAGPGEFSQLRVRRGDHTRLRLQVHSLWGVHWQQVALFRQRGMQPLPLHGTLCPASGVVDASADLSALGPDETLLLHAPEDVQCLPPVPMVLEGPRRGLATRGWSLL